MKSDLALLNVNKVIIHEVPKHSKNVGGSGPIYSEIESPLDPELALYFQEKMIGSLGSNKSFDICIDPGCVSPVPGLLTKHLGSDGKDFVGITKQVAEHLYNIQDGTNPGGLLAVLDCIIKGERALGLIKLEKEEGVRLKQRRHGGQRTFDLHVLRDLVLTERTRVYKLALFVVVPDKGDDYDAAASDNQTGYGSYNEVASFFLSRFLGCKLRKEPEIATKHFYEAAEAFINEKVEDPVSRSQYYGHVVSEMLSQSPTLSTEQFAETYLPVDLRKSFVNHLEAKEVPANFPKNNELINKKLKKTLYEFRSGIRVIAPSDLADDRIKLTNLENGETKLEIQDRLEEVKGK
ncbi:MAG TPA: nucleoid-associated protein [Pyrinomonadaceae bacterium]|jgi:hypothetical protein|nr:nucleoid-associated protein [Pyrinomonadaceae bacterium]